MSTTLIHGTASTYSNGCRCDSCRTARREYQRELKQRRRSGDTTDLRRQRSPVCKHGHDMTDENTYIRRNGRRDCRKCKSRMRAKQPSTQGHAWLQHQHSWRLRGGSFTAPRTGEAWEATEDELVLAHKVTDRELSQRLGRSIKAIHVRRSKLKQEAD